LFAAAVFKGGRWMATLVLCIHGAFAALIILSAILYQLDFTRFVKFLLSK
jgi:hypothetical protein